MAQKKKSKRKSRKTAEDLAPSSERSAFWPLAGGILLILLAIFMLLGGFGTGGVLPVDLFKGAYGLLGWAAYLTPVALAYWGVQKFKSEDRRIPMGKFISMLCVLLFAAGLSGVMFASKSSAGQISGGHGGAAGQLLSMMSLGALDKLPASLLFFVATLLAVFFAFGISPKILLKLLDPFKRNPKENEEITDLAALKAKGADQGFQLKAGVPVEGLSEPAIEATPKPRLSSFRNSAQKLTSSENHEALTTTSDTAWQLPSLDLLNQSQDKADPGNVKEKAATIHDTLANFNIEVTMEGANVGPRVTQYTLKPSNGVKLNKITALENNLALDLAAKSIRIEAPIPGKSAVGIEVPNNRSATVRLSSLLQSKEWQTTHSPLSFAVGKDIAGKPVVEALDKMPHLLVAGQTNSGKSVMVNAILTSLLYHNSPSDMKLILVDPKHVELTPYDAIPHLLTPVITEPEKCISALKWAVAEMERRYKALAEAKRRNIIEYNELKKEEGMPYIVIVIDELADLMMMAARDVEALIVRLAQKARAVGIHLIVATQSPRVTVITGLIKANIPARVAFTVSQEVESRIILDQSGAEKLLGMGDMLYTTATLPKPVRVQGALIEIEEVQKVTDFLRMQREATYDDEVISQPVQLNGKGGVVADYTSGGDEPIYQDAVRVVIESGKASTSLLQRRLGIGYGRAAKLIDTMEEQGIVSSASGNKPREVLVSSIDQVFGGGDSEADAALEENFADERV